MVVAAMVFDDDFVAGQGSPAPVHRDVGEQPMLDFIPFRGAGWEVADGDGEAGGVGQRGQLFFGSSLDRVGYVG